MFTLATEPQGVGRNLDSGFRLLFAGIGSAALLLVFMIVLDAILFVMLGADFFAMMEQIQTGQFPTSGMGKIALFVVLLYTINIIFSNAMIAKYGAIAYGQEMTIGIAITVGLKKLLPVFAYAILYMLALLVSSIPLFILMSIFPPPGTLAIIGMLIGIIPPMIISLTLILGSYLIIIDDIGIFDALTRSHKLIWGNWWRTAMYLTIIIVIMLAIILAIEVTVGLLIGFIASIGPGEGGMSYMIVLQAINQLVSLAFMPVMIALIIPYYHDLKLRKEGGDLAAKITAF